jgi:hypothetical protein
MGVGGSGVRIATDARVGKVVAGGAAVGKGVGVSAQADRRTAQPSSSPDFNGRVNAIRLNAPPGQRVVILV